MLQWHVDIFHDFRACRYGLHQLRAPMSRVCVEKPHPKISRNLFDPLQQPCQSGPSRRVNGLAWPGLLVPEIHPIVSRILTYQVDFFDALFDEVANLGDDRLDRSAAMPA